MDLDGFRKFVGSVEWGFAKTYAKKSPHWYIITNRMPQHRTSIFRSTFFLNKFGADERYFSAYFRTFYCDGWKYWTMDKTVSGTQIINKTNKVSCEQFGIAWTPQPGYKEVGYQIDGCVTDEEFHLVNDIGEIRKMRKGVVPASLQGELWL